MTQNEVKYKEYKKPFSYRDFLEWSTFKTVIEHIVEKWDCFDYIKTSIENGDLTEYVKDVDSIFAEPFSGVFLTKNESQEIILSDIFYAYMWSYSYFFLILHDYSITYSKAKLGIDTSTDAPTYDMLVGAVLAKQHADLKIVLGTTRDTWDYYPHTKSLLPNPFIVEEQLEFYISKVNGIYAYAVAFIMGHEYHHFFYGDNYKELDAEESQKNELDADATSLEKYAILETAEERNTFAAGIATALMVIMLLEKRPDFPSEDADSGHPQTILRIMKDVEKLSLPDDDPLYDYLGFLFESYSTQSMQNTSIQYGTAKEYFEKMLTKMD